MVSVFVSDVNTVNSQGIALHWSAKRKHIFLYWGHFGYILSVGFVTVQNLQLQLCKEPKSLDAGTDIEQPLPGLPPPSYDETETPKNDKIHEKTGVKYPEPLEGDGWPKTTGLLKAVTVDEDGLEIIKMLKNGFGVNFFGYLTMIR